MKDSGDKISPEDKAKVEEAVKKAKEELESNDNDPHSQGDGRTFQRHAGGFRKALPERAERPGRAERRRYGIPPGRRTIK